MHGHLNVRLHKKFFPKTCPVHGLHSLSNCDDIISLKGRYKQGDASVMVSILVGNNIGHCGRRVCVNMCLILNGYRDVAV